LGLRTKRKWGTGDAVAAKGGGHSGESSLIKKTRGKGELKKTKNDTSGESKKLNPIKRERKKATKGRKGKGFQKKRGAGKTVKRPNETKKRT